MLTSIPVISPIEIVLGEPGVRRLPAPDYEIHALPAAAVLAPASAPVAPPDPALNALDDMDRAAQIGEYHDFSWWDERIRIIRGRLQAATTELG